MSPAARSGGSHDRVPLTLPFPPLVEQTIDVDAVPVHVRRGDLLIQPCDRLAARRHTLHVQQVHHSIAPRALIHGSLLVRLQRDSPRPAHSTCNTCSLPAVASILFLEVRA